jgi:serine/threonine protein phosphatase PrpC
MSAAPPNVIEVAGCTDVGCVRAGNEDAMLVDVELGLYAVFDGMGGAKAGEVAAQTARDAVRSYVARNADQLPPMDLLENALLHACATVFDAARADRNLHGMGTTAVVCLIPDLQRPKKAVIAHVGDSRAYLLRNGRLSQLTRDHTIVAELVARGMITAEDAESHQYKNVLSRNLGARFEAAVDVVATELHAGDRLMLCSDGLYGYAANEAILYLLGSGDAPQHVARDLIELALRGGGGDNVTAVVIDAGVAAATTTQVVRTSGASSWWQQRARYVAVARERGLGRSPLCRGLPADEAIELVAGSFCEALYHDLEKSTGVNVWTFAQNLGTGWLDHGGDWAVLRGVLDILQDAAVAVVDAIRTVDRRLGPLLDIAVARALIVTELAAGNLLADRLRAVERELVDLHAVAAAAEPATDSGRGGYVEDPTIPFLRADGDRAPAARRAPSPRGEVPGSAGDGARSLGGLAREIATAVRSALTIARAAAPADALLVQRTIAALEATAIDGEDAPAVVAEAREVYGVRTLDDIGLPPLFEALERVRLLVTTAVHQTRHSDAVKCDALRVLSTCHRRLVATITGLILDAVEPSSQRLRDAQRATAYLRDELETLERRRVELDRPGTAPPARVILPVPLDDEGSMVTDSVTEVTKPTLAPTAPTAPMAPMAPMAEDTLPSLDVTGTDRTLDE